MYIFSKTKNMEQNITQCRDSNSHNFFQLWVEERILKKLNICSHMSMYKKRFVFS